MSAGFKVGNRVRYTGKDSRHCNNNMIGMTGTITGCPPSDPEHAEVRWDDDRVATRFPYFGNLQLLESVTKEQVDQALDLLAKAGVVTFKPFRPPFEQVVVKLNKSYTATITGKSVTVGCQSFPFEVIKEVAAAVAAAEKYNSEG